jgi:hypothetical protein
MHIARWEEKRKVSSWNLEKEHSNVVWKGETCILAVKQFEPTNKETGKTTEKPMGLMSVLCLSLNQTGKLAFHFLLLTLSKT